jgi:hypothetical protein
LNETGAALRVFVLRRRALGFARLPIVKIIADSRAFPDAVLMMETDVEPDRAVKGPVLIDTEPG